MQFSDSDSTEKKTNKLLDPVKLSRLRKCPGGSTSMHAIALLQAT